MSTNKIPNVEIGIGKPCPTCQKPMTRFRHGDGWVPGPTQPRWAEFWDKCPHHGNRYYPEATRLQSQTEGAAAAANTTQVAQKDIRRAQKEITNLKKDVADMKKMMEMFVRGHILTNGNVTTLRDQLESLDALVREGRLSPDAEPTAQPSSWTDEEPRA